MNDAAQKPSVPSDSAGRLPAEARLKMHLRLLRLGGETCRVVTLRPSTRIGFSTNFYHQTWHIVTNQRGARLLARLLWGLSYQRQPGTLLLVCGDHLLPTPFEAERSDPFLLVPTGLSPLDKCAFRTLKGHLNHLGPPTTTIRWHTFGLDAALRARQSEESPPADQGTWRRDNRLVWRQERMQRLGGFVVYSAPPPVLRQQALAIHSLRVGTGSGTTGMDYHFLARESSKESWVDGEVQIFADYTDRVAAATQARRELVPNPNEPIVSEARQEAVSRQRDWIKARKARNRARRRA